MDKYKLTRDDVSYEDDDIVVLVKDVNVCGNMDTPIDLIHIGIEGLKKGESTLDLLYKKDRNGIIDRFIGELKNLKEK